jgi:hypothetical protein
VVQNDEQFTLDRLNGFPVRRINGVRVDVERRCDARVSKLFLRGRCRDTQVVQQGRMDMAELVHERRKRIRILDSAQTGDTTGSENLLPPVAERVINNAESCLVRVVLFEVSQFESSCGNDFERAK